MNIRIGKLSNIISPQYSCCMRCETTWNFVTPHCTNFTANEGMFPLCEKCWSEITPDQRLPYYIELYNEWNKKDDTEIEMIKSAVLDGK